MITRMTRRLGLALAVFLPALLCSHIVHAQSANNVYAQVKRSVGIVIVSTFEGQLVGSGSAVTVASQTMVTNRHVLIPGHRYQVYTSGGIHEAYMTICDSTQDLCLLEVRSLEAAPVEFGDANRLGVGDTVYAIGAPNEIGNIVGVANATKQKSYSAPQLTLSNGLITALRPVEDGNIIQTNAAMSPGSSGGGLFDVQGRLIGITTFMMRSGQSLNMALPVNWVERLGVKGATRAADVGMPTTQEAFAQRPQTNSAASRAQPVHEPETQAPEQQASSPVVNSPPPAESLLNRYWWVGLPILLILIYLFRRRSNEADEEYYEPSPANQLLQRFLDEAQQELDQNRPDPDLWRMELADNKGNMQAAQQSYIKRRAARLLSMEKDKQWAAAARQSQAT
jgi:S1-C subfamily serine protease